MISTQKNKIKNWIFIFLLFCRVCSFAQAVSNEKIFISKDSLNFTFSEKWKYFPGDSPAMAARDFDDRTLESIQSYLRMDKISSDKFKGIGWFRIHFIGKYSRYSRGGASPTPTIPQN